MIFLSIWRKISDDFRKRIVPLRCQKTGNMCNIIGREPEIALLREYENSGKSEFVALYGRRRVGKTFLVRELYGSQFVFEVSGLIEGEEYDQLKVFNEALNKYGPRVITPPQDWFEAFACLQLLLNKHKRKKRIILFIDELPCFDTHGSKFITALDHFWNGWAAHQKNIMLIVCGSATSWMIRNIIDNHGGLHNRITHEMHLHPFTLHETELYLNANKFNWNRLSTAQAYMILGGIPYYLSLLQPNESLPQNIDRLFFAENAEMHREYKRLFKSLFKNPEPYLLIMEELAKKKSGMTRDEIATALGLSSGGGLSDRLEDLVYCDFIRRYYVKEKKIKSTSAIYQMTDFFTFFYLTFCLKPPTNPNFWVSTIDKPIQNIWFGLAYERLAMAHIPQIKRALRIDSIQTNFYSWRSKQSDPAVQIDLIIERADQVTNVCEVKYSQKEYAIDKDEDLRLRDRCGSFKEETKTRAAIHPVLVTTFGMKRNMYSDYITAEVTLDDLFE